MATTIQKIKNLFFFFLFYVSSGKLEKCYTPSVYISKKEKRKKKLLFFFLAPSFKVSRTYRHGLFRQRWHRPDRLPSDTSLPPWRNFTFIEWPNVLQLITQNSHNEKQCVNQAAEPWRGHRLNAKRSLLGPLQTGISLSDWLSGGGRRWWHFTQAGIGVLTKPSSQVFESRT